LCGIHSFAVYDITLTVELPAATATFISPVHMCYMYRSHWSSSSI